MAISAWFEGVTPKIWSNAVSWYGRKMPALAPASREITILILTLDDVKTQLRLELDFTEHDAMLTQMVNAAQRSIERDYYCKLVTSDEELQALPETVRGFIADEDIQAGHSVSRQRCISEWPYRTMAGNRCGGSIFFPDSGAYAMSLKPGDMNCRIAD